MAEPAISAYTPAQKALHWTMAALVLSNIPMGIVMGNLAQGPLQDRLYNLHRSLGALILVLALARLLLRRRVGAPPPHPSLARWQQIAATATHHGLYALIVLAPILGWAATSAYGAQMVMFGLFELPPILPQNEALSKVLFVLHKISAIGMALLVIMHIGAAMMHAVRRDGVMGRML